MFWHSGLAIQAFPRSIIMSKEGTYGQINTDKQYGQLIIEDNLFDLKHLYCIKCVITCSVNERFNDLIEVLSTTALYLIEKQFCHVSKYVSAY